MPHAQIRFNKPARAPAELVIHLQSRGLTILDANAAEVFIARVGYYRLLIYMRPLQDPSTKLFFAGTTFKDIENLYTFDRKLRLLCLDAIEKVEVALRAAIVNKLAVTHTAHFYTRSRHFDQCAGFKEFMEKIIKAKGASVDHYYGKYNDPSFPPIWTILETITIGTLSQLYSKLHVKNRKLIAKSFNYDEQLLVSWYRAITGLRNKCAHHNRVWDAIMNVDQPAAAKKIRTVFGTSRNKFYARAVVLAALMDEIEAGSSWKADLKALIAAYPAVAVSNMGFPVGWETMAFWTT